MCKHVRFQLRILSNEKSLIVSIIVHYIGHITVNLMRIIPARNYLKYCLDNTEHTFIVSWSLCQNSAVIGFRVLFYLRCTMVILHRYYMCTRYVVTILPLSCNIPGTMIFLYLMVCSIQKKMNAKFCWGFKELWAFKIRYHLIY